jgi:hypothetical protein
MFPWTTNEQHGRYGSERERGLPDVMGTGVIEREE